MDVENGIEFAQKNCPELSHLLNIMHLADVFRVLYPQKVEFYRPNSAASRLDRLYIPSSLTNKVLLVEHLSSLSDHQGLRVDMLLDLEGENASMRNSNRSKSSYWNLNTSILKDEDFNINFIECWHWLQSLLVLVAVFRLEDGEFVIEAKGHVISG